MFREVQKGSPGVAVIQKLWADCVGEEGFAYKLLSLEELEGKLMGPMDKVHKLTFLHESGRAFVSGTYVDGEKYGYITMLIVEKESRRQGLGKEMLNALETEIKSRYQVEEMRIIFFNPVTLVWEVPGHPGCEHPNSPGVDVTSAAYKFFQANGYQKMATQNSYFIELKNYEFPQAMQEKEAQLNADGYFIRPYDPETMHGMEEMILGLNNPMWTRDILGEPEPKDGGRPILVPEKDGVVLGFTGPLDVEPSGRGFFAGIAVDSRARGRGVAKVLFSALCRGLRGVGASYMTLFTGEENPARRIYEAAGFTIVKTWEDMKKSI